MKRVVAYVVIAICFLVLLLAGIFKGDYIRIAAGAIGIISQLMLIRNSRAT